METEIKVCPVKPFWGMKNSVIFLLAFLLPLTVLSGQKIATIEVEINHLSVDFDHPVSVNLDDITNISDTLLSLCEVGSNYRKPVAFQVEAGDQRRLYWMVSSSSEGNSRLRYELIIAEPEHYTIVKATEGEGALTLNHEDKNLLRYWFSTVYPPPGVDSSYKRSGFIHPLWSPNGQVLTRIQPPDHYHHYGIWNPWTRVLFEGDTVDFWNIDSRQGTVRFANFVSVTEGPVFACFEVLHEHVVYRKDGNEKVALNELQKIMVYKPGHQGDHFIVDFCFRFSCAGESPFRILEYRYSGLGWRTTSEWNKDNSMVITSEGKTRKDADGSIARWCIVQGEADNDHAGVVMMSSPSNYNHPEPLRVWPENQYERGDMFVNFCPVKTTDWLLRPRKNYSLRYRFLVFNGRMRNRQAEQAWNDFSVMPRITITKCHPEEE